MRAFEWVAGHLGRARLLPSREDSVRKCGSAGASPSRDGFPGWRLSKELETHNTRVNGFDRESDCVRTKFIWEVRALCARASAFHA